MNFIGKALWQSLAAIKFLHDFKEFVELILSFVFGHHGFKIVHHLDENSNAVRKDHDSEEEHHRAKYSLVIGFGMEVAESHGGQRCESIVLALDHLLEVTVLVELVMRQKADIFLVGQI